MALASSGGDLASSGGDARGFDALKKNDMAAAAAAIQGLGFGMGGGRALGGSINNVGCDLRCCRRRKGTTTAKRQRKARIPYKVGRWKFNYSRVVGRVGVESSELERFYLS